MICKHQFEKVADAVKSVPNTPRPVAGVEVVCTLCGQTRKAFVDGEVRITNEGQGPINEDHGGNP